MFYNILFIFFVFCIFCVFVLFFYCFVYCFSFVLSSSYFVQVTDHCHRLETQLQ